MATFLTVDLCQGDLVSPEFQITSAGAPLNLAGLTVEAVIKPSPAIADDASAAISRTVGSGLTILDAAAGKVSVDVPAEVTAEPGAWFFKITVLSAAKPVTAIYGWLKVIDT